MSLRSKSFFFIVIFSLSSFFVLISSANYSLEREKQIQIFTQVTKLPHIALSTSSFQKRVLYYDDYSNKLYPQMKQDNKMDYIYAQ